MYSLPIEYFGQTSPDSIRTHSNRFSFHHESKALPPQPSTCTACEGFKTPLHKSPVVFRNSVPAEFIVLSLVFWVSSFVSRQSSPYYNWRDKCSRKIQSIFRYSISI